MPTSPPSMTPLQLGVFVRLVLGYPRWRIAAELSEGEDVVSALEQSPEVLQALADARNTLVANAADIQAKFSGIAMDAAGVLENLMHGARNEAVRRAAARDVLEFGGHKPPETINHNVSGRHAIFNVHALDPAEMEFLRAVAEKAARAFAGGTATPPAILPPAAGSGNGNNNP